MDSSPCHSSTLLDIESASSALAALDLIEESRLLKKMDRMETDLVLEVPDTPDRLRMMRQSENVVVEDSPSSTAGPSYMAKHNWQNNRHAYIGRETNSLLDNESLFEMARWARSNSNFPDSNGSPQQKGDHITTFDYKEDRVSLSNSLGHCDEHRPEINGTVIDLSSPLNVSHLTRCGNDMNNCGKVPSGHLVNTYIRDCNEAGSAPQSQAVRRTRSGICFPSRLPDSTRKTEMTNTQVKGLDINDDSQNKSRHVQSSILKSDDLRRNSAQMRLVSKGQISPLHRSRPIPPVNEGRETFIARGTVRGKGKGIRSSSDSMIEAKEMVPNSSRNNVSLRLDGRRRLVRNGCISPSNIMRRCNTEEKKVGFGKQPHTESPNDFLSSQLHDDSEAHQKSKEKGKEILDESLEVNVQDVKSGFSARRVEPLPAENCALTVDGCEDSSRFIKETNWRTTGNRKGNLSIKFLKRKDEAASSSTQTSKIQSNESSSIKPVNFGVSSGRMALVPQGSFSISDQSIADVVAEPETTDIHHGPRKLVKGKRKSRSRRSQIDIDITESLGSSSLTRPSNTVSTRRQSSQQNTINQGLVIDVDDLSSPRSRHRGSENGRSMASNDLTIRDCQVESDELLARQLQEQLFNESPVFGGSDEVDAGIAWALQQEEAAHRFSLSTNRRSQYLRDTSTAHLYREYPNQTLQNNIGRPRNHALASSRMSFLRRTGNRSQMDLESRINYLEALEAISEGNTDTISNPLLRLQRDFNENDYEMLLALDEDNHNHVGASVHQINSLPLSVIQNGNSDEACAVCLEVPTVGDAMRHLPCLHRFHKDCIDPWLRRRTSCPICKSGIA